MNRIGDISEAILESIITVCFTYNDVKALILYGSRARGDYKQGSDIDIAIDAPQMSSKEFAQLWNALDDLPIIFPMDIVHLQSIKNELFLNAIRRDGIVIKKR
jgi:proline iminopeptidase